MSKVADFVNISSDNLWLQPEGYNPSGSFKDNGMATAVTHGKLVNAKKIVCASTGNTSAAAGMFAVSLSDFIGLFKPLYNPMWKQGWGISRSLSATCNK